MSIEHLEFGEKPRPREIAAKVNELVDAINDINNRMGSAASKVLQAMWEDEYQTEKEEE